MYCTCIVESWAVSGLVCREGCIRSSCWGRLDYCGFPEEYFYFLNFVYLLFLCRYPSRILFFLRFRYSTSFRKRKCFRYLPLSVIVPPFAKALFRLAHKVHIYLEYHSVCPLVRIGTPTPSPPSECAPPPGTKGRERNCLRGREWGGGVPITTTGEKA